MQDIKIREEKMKEKRRNTPWREFVKEICSRRALSFYKVNNLISRYPYTDRIKGVVPGKEFISKRDGLLNYGLNFSGNSFFGDFQNLFKSIPLENTLLFSGCENSEYADQSMNTKNTYLSYVIVGGENILYSMVVKDNSKNIFNCVSIVKSENIYRSFNIVNSYNIFFSKQIDNSSELWFCTNMIGCHNCIFCNNLENKSYCIENRQYTKEEFINTKKYLLSKKSEFLGKFELLNKDIISFISRNVSGLYLTECSDIIDGYYLHATHNSKNAILISGGDSCKNLYDTFTATGFPIGEQYYGIMGCAGGNNVYNSVIIPRCSNTYYSYGMENCSFCLGCIGLVNKSFCILNKQYTKEERFELANKIFEKMDQTGDLGKFFPASMNPFYFNDTVAYLIDDSFTKEEVTKEGYLWRDEKIKVDIPEGKEIVLTSPFIPLLVGEGGDQRKPGEVKTLNDFQSFDSNGNRQINPEILKKVIVDEQGNYYTIQKMELEFLQKYGLPLPEIHRLDRIKLGFRFK